MRPFRRCRSSHVEQRFELSRKAFRFALLIVPPLVAATASCHVAIDARESNAPAISNFMKIKEDGDGLRSRSRESREFRKFRKFRKSEFWARAHQLNLNCCLLIFK